MPEEWYYWPDEADEAYQAQVEQWRQDYAIGNDYPPPIRDLNRIVFLETNMPPELQGLSVDGLIAKGVQRVPGSSAGDFIISTTRFRRASPSKRGKASR